jgi:hypothetical protein
VVWRPVSKLANGTHKLFVPADWTLPSGTPVHAVAARNVRGGFVDTRGLSGWNGGGTVHSENSDWPAVR